jgi:acyl carrier protein
MHNIAQDIRTFVTTNFLFGQDATALSDDQSFLETGIIDSTGVLELIAFLEQQYSISVDDHEVVPANLDSVQHLVAYVERKLQARGERVAS